MPISTSRTATDSQVGQPSIEPNNFPTDWPGPGPLNLAVHDLPHASSTIEWWYVNSHLTLSDGRACSLFASFFQLAVGRDEQTGALQFAHSMTWAITDASAGTYHSESLVDPLAPEIGLEMLDQGDETTDPLLQRALREVLVKKNVPSPDRLMTRPAVLSGGTLSLDYDGNRFVKQPDGRYRLTIMHADGQTGCDLFFAPQTAPVRHGDDGVVRGTSGEDMFYYFMPNCIVEGELTLAGQPTAVAQASGWYDHEFGKPTTETPRKELRHDIAWNWISVQLVNGYQISAYDLYDNLADGASCGHWIVVVDPAGAVQQYDKFTLLPLHNWTSTRTFTTYPTAWQLDIPAAGISLYADAEFAAQEFVTMISKPAFWEGRMRVSGTFQGESVVGMGYVERSGFGTMEQLSDFFRAVTKETRKAVQALLPLTPSDDQLYSLVATNRHHHYLDGLNRDQYSRTLLKPIREMVDRGGKSWRSYAALACMDAVGGNSQLFVNWLAWPELLHTGSLIVDDVQDRSVIRRGDASCHMIYGEATAINAGNACYFLGELLLANSALTDAQKLAIYAMYFEMMRAAHAGQAIDIDGFDSLMPEVVAYSRGSQLEERILAVHRLKSAVPARSLAELGVVIAGGSTAQAAALGDFFEALGLAFQIIDDVLNLRGFENDLKTLGEDIMCGKVTMPVAKAMSRLPLTARQSLWQTIHRKPQSPEVVADVIATLENCGAIDACQQQASELVEAAWARLDELIPDSDVKIKLRAFGWYVLERHY
ncbi:polyprenyl synthetase family protein [Fibrella arboris]|uniref:polyprenyl synthetase family protein n=1 Tax=Fibrella arboris TaxID=3242486 RepID=UPI003520E0FC